MGVIGWLLLVWALVTAYEVWGMVKLLTPAECTAGKSCVRPRFLPEENVDLHVFVSKANAKREQWSRVDDNGKGPLATFKPSTEQSFVVNISLAKLNGSFAEKDDLVAHFVVVKQGASPEETSVKLETSSRLTDLLKPSTVSYSNLVEDATASGKGNHFSMRVFQFNIDITGSLKWCAVFLLASAFQTPSLTIAALRGGVAFGVVPFLYQQYRSAEERFLEEQDGEHHKREMLSRKLKPQTHIRRRFNIRFTTDDGVYGSVPILYIKVQPSMSTNLVRYKTVQGEYLPEFYVDPELRREPFYTPLFPSSEEQWSAFRVNWLPLSRVHNSVMKTIDQGFERFLDAGMSEEDLYDVKSYLFRYPLHILIAMQVIGFLQVTLSTLAFKNEVQFFKGISDYTGLSSRTLVTDVLHTLVIFLYNYDYEYSSRIILFQLGMETLIGLWKVKVRMRLHLFFQYALPWVGHDANGESSLGEQATEEIDARAMRYLKIVLFPLSGFWGIYCLLHYQYTSWWSWFVSSAADFAYTFGFINMTPQIFLNYKLKSVAHMPWRVLMYKFFTTFIDDFFAFVIMRDHISAKHRWMTLRDDVIFFIFLGQLYLYPIDKARADEYGFVYENPEALAAAQTKGAEQTDTKVKSE